MRRATRWWVGAVLAVVAVGPAAWAEREKKPAPAPAKPSDPGLKPPAGKPTAAARPGSGAMVKIDGGTFRMGREDTRDNEKPVHEVRLATFWMDVTEVTVAAYRACVSAGSCTKPDTDGMCNWEKSAREGHPINCVDWSQATAFCKWANKRLPTEEEWEFAAKPSGSGGDRYPWGDAPPGDQLCWNRKMSEGTCAVGSFQAGTTRTGLKDMAGNVWEWTASQHCPYAAGGYDMGKCEDARTGRGGAWDRDYPNWQRVAYRLGYSPMGSGSRVHSLGFRCARSE